MRSCYLLHGLVGVYFATCLLHPVVGYISFFAGNEYQYQYNSTVTLHGVGDFLVQAKVVFENIDTFDSGIELAMTVRDYGMVFNKRRGDNDLDFTKWFSIEISHRGEIMRFLYPKDEDPYVLTLKTGFATLLAGKFMEAHETGVRTDGLAHTYVTKENGHEGPHHALYTVAPTDKGKKITRKRINYKHEVLNLDTTKEKDIYYDDELEAVHRIDISEVISMHSSKEGFQPHFAMRKVKAVNSFSDTEYPEIKTSTKGSLIFIARHKQNKPTIRSGGLTAGYYNVSNSLAVTRGFHFQDINATIQDVRSNLTSLKELADKGSIDMLRCFETLINILRYVPEEILRKVAEEYFTGPDSSTLHGEAVWMLDVFASMNTELSNTILIEMVLQKPDREPLTQRWLMHIGTTEGVPRQELAKSLLAIIRSEDHGVPTGWSQKTIDAALLALGSLAHQLRLHGNDQTTHDIVEYLQSKLGLHDPWEWRQKRSAMTEDEHFKHDKNKVILLEALGNGAHDASFEFIISHTNSSIAPWVKRSGVHALRHYHTRLAVDAIQKVAFTDDNEEVRYEAMLQYQAHPLAEPQSMQAENSTTDDNNTSTVVETGPHLIRSKRSLLQKELKFRLQAPSVDWRKVVGSTSIGASFGVIMINYFDLKMSLLSGWMKVEIHDEVYARAHIGVLGLNVDFFSARMCFKGGADYDVNTILEFDPIRKAREFIQLAKSMKTIIDNIVNGVNRLKDIIGSGPSSLKMGMERFMTAFKDLPKRVLNLRKTANTARERLGHFVVEGLPDFFKPIRNTVQNVASIFYDVKSDVMEFHNALSQTLETRVPRATKRFFMAVQDIIKSFGQFLRDPQATLSRIGKGVVNIGFSIAELKKVRTTIEGLLFPTKDKKPYWLDLGEVVSEISVMVTSAVQSLETGAPSWIKEIAYAEDLVKQLTSGHISIVEIKKQIIAECKDILAGMLKPIHELKSLANLFFNAYEEVVNVIKDMKKSYEDFVKGFKRAKTLINGIIGARCPPNFPRKIRLPTGLCSGDGFYKSSLRTGLTEYKHAGVDVDIVEGANVPAPFSGYTELTDSETEVKIRNVEELPDGSDVIISNIVPRGDIPTAHDTLKEVKYVSAGDVIGVAAESPCKADTSHIHFAVLREGGTVDPTRYLPPRDPKLPKWIQKCNDYKVMYKGMVVGIDTIGQSTEEDTSGHMKGDLGQVPVGLDDSESPSFGSDSANEFLSRSRGSSGQFLANIGGIAGDAFSALMNKTDAFLERFSINRLKLGELTKYMSASELQESKQKLFSVLDTVAGMVISNQCKAPDQMTDVQLIFELIKRGKDRTGDRAAMIKMLTSHGLECPALSFGTLDLKHLGKVYCDYDEMCLGLQCCVSLNLLDMIQRTVSATIQFFPQNMTLHMAFGKWNYQKQFNSQFEDYSDIVKTGIRFDFVNLEVFVRYNVKMTLQGIRVGVGVGLLPSTDVLWNLFDIAFQIPTINLNGTYSLPQVNWTDYFNTTDVKQSLLDGSRKLAEQSKTFLVQRFLEELGINEDDLKNTANCPIPQKMSTHQLLKELSKRGISNTGSRNDLIHRLERLDKTCTSALNSSLTVPDLVPDEVDESIYIYISTDCMKINACVDIPIPGLDISKSFLAYIELDPCKFVVQVGFEKWKRSFYLFDYDWGKEESLKLTHQIHLTCTIDRNLDENVFILSARLQFTSLIDEQFIDQLKIPIPVCNDNFYLPGKGDLETMANELGGQITENTFNLFLKSTGLDEILQDSGCGSVNVSSDCAMDIDDFIPRKLQEIVQCTLLDGCLGIQCCLVFDFEIPFSTQRIAVAIPFYLRFDPCEMDLQINVLSHRLKERMLEYDWGERRMIYLGNIDDTVTVMFRMDSHEDHTISIDVELLICIPLGTRSECIPKGGLHILENKLFQPCNFSEIWRNDVEQSFSLSEWLSGGVKDLEQLELGEAALDYVLERLKLSNVVTNSCDRTRSPYSPSVDGWNVGCQEFVVNLPSLPSFINCYIEEDCSSISCCVDVDLLGLSLQFVLELDICSNSIVAGMEKARTQFENVLSEYTWGSWETINAAEKLFLAYKVEKAGQSKYIVDMTAAACFDRDGSCLFNITLLHQTVLPQRVCQGVNSTCLRAALTSTHDCIMDEDCQGLICNVLRHSNSLLSEDLHMVVKFRLNHCYDEAVFSIGEKRWVQSLSSISRGKSYTHGFLNKMTFVIEETGASFAADLNITNCKLTDDNCTDTVVFENMSLRKGSCNLSHKRRKRETNTPTNLGSELKTLLQNGADDADLNGLIDRFRLEEIESRRSILRSIDLGVQDTSSFPSILNSLGSKNPFSLPYTTFVNNVTTTIMEGANEIIDHLKRSGPQIPSSKLFELGVGLTDKGLEALGSLLANITIGDLLAVLELNNIDPAIIQQLIVDLTELIQDLISSKLEHMVDSILGNTFSSSELTLEGQVKFPIQVQILLEHMFPPIMVGPIPVQIYFGAGCSYGIDLTIGAKILQMAGTSTITPFGGLSVWGGFAIGAALYAKLEIRGHIIQLRFPTSAEFKFAKFPLDVSLKMDLEMVPLVLELRGLCTFEIKIPFIGRIKIVIFSAAIWRNQLPSIRKPIFKLSTKKEDTSPPAFGPPVDTIVSSPKRASGTQSCEVYQLAGRDYTLPGFEIAVSASDDLSRIRYFLKIGTAPGTSDVVRERELGGATSKLYEMLPATGVPLYFTVSAQNSAGSRSSTMCSIPSYDVTIPSGRFTPDFLMTSNPSILKASIVSHDETALIHVAMGVGFGKGIYGDQLKRWENISLSQRTSEVDTGDDPFNSRTLEHFTSIKHGRLIGGVFRTLNNVHTAGFCARHCLDYPEHSCLSFNYDFGKSGTCELLKAIEGHDFSLAMVGLYAHYERLGIGHAVEFEVNSLSLEHNWMLMFNLDMRNALGYHNIISTKGILVDFTTPEPGFMISKKDFLETVPCSSVLPDDHPEWQVYCREVDGRIQNHRVIEDQAGSETVFNGAEAKTDLKYTRSNNYVSANWDGFHDNETGIRGYTLAVGRTLCEDMIHPHHNPMRHLLHRSQWDNKGQIYPLPPPYTILEDGAYFLTVRAINQVEFGGPLTLTVCHATPLIIDTSPPVFYEIHSIRYDEQSHFIYALFNFSDPHSGMLTYDFCLGETTHDCRMLSWNGIEMMTSVAYRFRIFDGVPAWVKIRGRNHVELRTVGVANQAIIVDSTPPVNGSVNDGQHFKQDSAFTKENSLVCANWVDFYDPESGIVEILMGAGSQPGLTDIAQMTRFQGAAHEACIQPDKVLQHGNSYYVVVTAVNGAIVQRNATSFSNGVFVDLTSPIEGSVVDGIQNDFMDLKYTASKSTAGLQWKGYTDPESGIEQYSVKVLGVSEGQEAVLQDWKVIGNVSTKALWKHFHLQHNSKVYSKLKVTNDAENEISSKTDGFIVDHTPPSLLHFGDGDQSGQDIDFQVDDTSISVNYGFEDLESGLNLLRFQIYGRHNGQKTQIFPATPGEWHERNGSIAVSTFIHPGLALKRDTLYTVRVGAANKAGILGIHETDGVMMDNTKPHVVWLRVGELTGTHENIHDGYVYQSDHRGIKVSWLARDEESGIESVRVSIGSSKDEDDIYSWQTYNGFESDTYIGHLELQNTNLTTMNPVYYVNVHVFNGAGEGSDVFSSTPVAIVPEDVAGRVVDGPDFEALDVDYQTDASTLSVAFDGFESSLHGIGSFQWAIGTIPGGEDVQPYMAAGIYHDESLDSLTNGTVTSGGAQVSIELMSGTRYYPTLRGITNNGNVLQSQSNGIVVDTTPPAIVVKRTMGVESQLIKDPLYVSTTERSLASWQVEDHDNLLDGLADNVLSTWYTFGTYPGDNSVEPETMAQLTASNTAKLFGQHMDQSKIGYPTYLSISAANKAGMVSSVSPAAVIRDTTPPDSGYVTCDAFLKPGGQIQCRWTGFIDHESSIDHFLFSMDSEKSTSIVDNVQLSASTFSYIVKGITGQHADELFVTVKAVNTVQLEALAFSNKILIDTTPPVPGLVVELSRKTFLTDGASMDVLSYCDEDCQENDAVCQESFSGVSTAWHPFTDEESGMNGYEMAIGTTIDGNQVMDFIEVVPDPVTHAVHINSLNLYGLTKIFVRIKGINGAGMYSISSSNGVYLSYLSQNMDPPLPVGIWDSHPNFVGDVNFQEENNIIYSGWDVTGDPCPITQLEWAIERIDGQLLQSFQETNDMSGGINDRLALREGETFYSLLRVSNALGFQYTIRSNGITIRNNPLSAGRVFDGDVHGYDLNSLPSRSVVNCNWQDFGSGMTPETSEVLTGNTGVETSQETPLIAYYEVALGTDRRFPKTRDDVVPFTNVGTNTSLTFRDLELIPGIAVYYFSVRAYSESLSTAESTSNGFAVDFNGGVKAGSIRTGRYIASETSIQIQWEDFESKVDMLLYYVAVSSNTDAFNTSCKQYIDGGHAPDDLKVQRFDVYPVTNAGISTYVSIDNLLLSQGYMYYIWVMGVDKAGECNMTVANTTVDMTPPLSGAVTVGPYFDMSVAYSPSRTSVLVRWRGFEDNVSGIKKYTLSLLSASTCDTKDTFTQIGAPTELDSLYREYNMSGINLQVSSPHKIKLEVENGASLTTTKLSSPLLYDNSLPLPGDVREGNIYTQDVVWWGDTERVTGTLLQIQNRDASSCPVQNIDLQSDNLWHGLHLENRNVHYYPDFVKVNTASNSIVIKFSRDTKYRRYLTGAYSRIADIEGEGKYSFEVKASEGDTVTEMMFSDAPASEIQGRVPSDGDDFSTDNLCICCENTNITAECESQCACDDTTQNIPEGHVDGAEEYIPATKACGLQIYSGVTPYVVLWCRFYNSTETKQIRTPLQFSPSTDFHEYRLEFMKHREDLSVALSVQLIIDGEPVSKLYNIPYLSTSCNCIVHVLNSDPYVPHFVNVFNVSSTWTTRAIFRNIVFPPPIGELCRYGTPFQAGLNPIVRYEAGIGSFPGGTDVVAYREVLSPCRPCIDLCSRYSCSETCSRDKVEQLVFVLKDLNLEPTVVAEELNSTGPESYFVTVKAVSGAGTFATSTSNGFYVDTTRPIFDENVMIYIDTDQGEFTPVNFQGSNSTIKALWLCRDNQSEIQDNQWSIGTKSGERDIQPFVSTGTNTVGINDQLDGVLQHNTSYYVTIQCTNEAGLTTTYNDTKGVKVLLKSPDPNRMATEMTGVENLPNKTKPEGIKQMTDPTTIGTTFKVVDDPDVRRYDLCISSTNTTRADVLPCTWIGYNMSATVLIKGGNILYDGKVIYNLRELRPVVLESIETKSNFRMEPGRNLFVRMRLCNKAMKCSFKFVGAVVVTGEHSQLATADGINPFNVMMRKPATRQTRAVNDEIYVTTSDMPEEGLTLLVNVLDSDELATEYSSDASMDFVSYLTLPDETITDVDRYLTGRLESIGTTFIVGSLGQLPLSSELVITYPQLDFNTSDDNAIIAMLIHWDPSLQMWSLSSETCHNSGENVVHNTTKKTTSVKVCSTWFLGEKEDFFYKETQFAIAKGKEGFVNLPPDLIEKGPIEMNEDGGTSVLQLTGNDPEDDMLVYYLLPGLDSKLGTATLSSDGMLTFSPCRHCYGSGTLNIELKDVPSIEGIVSNTVNISLEVQLKAVNDAPTAFLLDKYGRSMLNPDKTEHVKVYLDKSNQTDKWITHTALFGAFDVDRGDSMELQHQTSSERNVYINVVSGEEYSDYFTCNSTSCLGIVPDVDPSEMAWLVTQVEYRQNSSFTGVDTVQLVTMDTAGFYSDVITVTYFVMELPCKHSGFCKAKSVLYPCDDEIRVTNFDDNFECVCTSQWQGTHCEEDVDECETSPCNPLYTCKNSPGSFQCRLILHYPILIAIGCFLVLCIIGIIYNREKIAKQIPRLRNNKVFSKAIVAWEKGATSGRRQDRHIPEIVSETSPFDSRVAHFNKPPEWFSANVTSFIDLDVADDSSIVPGMLGQTDTPRDQDNTSDDMPSTVNLDHGEIMPTTSFDNPSFSETTFSDTCTRQTVNRTDCHIDDTFKTFLKTSGRLSYNDILDTDGSDQDN